MRKDTLSTLLWPLQALLSGALEQSLRPFELCCFNLEARTTEANTPGFILELDPVLQTSSARYCLDTENGQLTNSRSQSGPLILVGLWTDMQMQEFPWVRTDMYGRFSILTSDGGDRYLLHDGRLGFYLRQGPPTSAYGFPNGHGTEVVAGESVIAVHLLLRDQSTHCERLERRIVPERRMTERHASREHKVLPTITSNQKTGSTPSLTCELSLSAPSLVPDAMYVGRVNGTTYSQTPIFVADIDPRSSTIFRFTLTDAFRTTASNWSSSGVCGLQFRLPVCTQLPRGYPCYRFSGMEQEALQMSGMRFGLLEGYAQSPAWRTQPLIQVWPGENTLVGTFECRQAVEAPGGDENELRWLAESVNGFALHFLQAGVGDVSQGVGAFVVACR